VRAQDPRELHDLGHARNLTRRDAQHIDGAADSNVPKIGRLADAKIIRATDDVASGRSYARPVSRNVVDRKVIHMLTPSRPLVIALALLAAVGLVLGLATDVGLFGWTFALLVVIYLAGVGVARLRARPA
jgi:hypothetical protein